MAQNESKISLSVHKSQARNKFKAVCFRVSEETLNSLSAQTYRPGYTNGRPQGKRAFQQEIARLYITVERAGEIPLPISLVPRVQKDDLIRVKRLDEPINGIRPNESFWNWTLVVAFVNPSRNEVEEESVSREINFKAEGWVQRAPF